MALEVRKPLEHLTAFFALADEPVGMPRGPVRAGITVLHDVDATQFGDVCRGLMVRMR